MKIVRQQQPFSLADTVQIRLWKKGGYGAGWYGHVQFGKHAWLVTPRRLRGTPSGTKQPRFHRWFDSNDNLRWSTDPAPRGDDHNVIIPSVAPQLTSWASLGVDHVCRGAVDTGWDQPEDVCTICGRRIRR